MGDGGREGDAGGLGGRGGLAAGELVAGADDGVCARFGVFVDEVGGPVDEGISVLIEGADELVGLNLVLVPASYCLSLGEHTLFRLIDSLRYL